MQFGLVLGHDVTNVGDRKDDELLNLPDQVGGGAFSVEATARFDDISRSWQRVFDFGNGEGSDTIAFGQSDGSNTTHARFEIRVGDTLHTLTTGDGAIVEGEMPLWKVGVDATGLVFIEKDGNRLTEGPGAVAPDVVRSNLLVGYSNTAAHNDMDGVVLGLRVNEPAFAATRN